MDDSVLMGIVSLTLVRCDVCVLPDLNAVLMSKVSTHTLKLSLNPAMYGIVRIKPFSCSICVWSLEGNSLETALIRNHYFELLGLGVSLLPSSFHSY